MDHSLPSPAALCGFFTSSLVSSEKPPIIDLHTHSTCSDGMLSPSQLVEKAASRGVEVLALTDHDTMEGIPEALQAANRLGIRLIPGVEISAVVGTGLGESNGEYAEPVHILGYYSGCGPARFEKLETVLAKLREARHRRAEAIICKLRSLQKPVTWERVVAMAGAGVAPGRVHIARALLEAGHVVSLREAFNKYLYDGGPAYEQGFALSAEDAVRLVIDTGGVAVLAHPWSLKDPVAVVKKLKAVGLHGMEVYRGDGKPNGFAALAETYDLLKLGGSDYHGRGEPDEVKLGKVVVPYRSIERFMATARPIWVRAMRDLIGAFAEESYSGEYTRTTTTKEGGRGVMVVTGGRHFKLGERLKGDMRVGYELEEEEAVVLLEMGATWLTEEEKEDVMRMMMMMMADQEEEEEDCEGRNEEDQQQQQLIKLKLQLQWEEEEEEEEEETEADGGGGRRSNRRRHSAAATGCRLLVRRPIPFL